MNFAIIGASGNVGRKTIEILEKSNLEFKNLFLVASLKSTGKKIRFRQKTIVIDNSSYFRMNANVPLVVPEVNSKALENHKNIISNPNCSTIQMVLPLKPLHDEYKIKRVIVSTYQAVSGAGKASVDELFSQTKEYLSLIHI